MSAKIYDETQQAFVDAETPKVYNGSEYVDSKGMSYNGSEWVEDWSGEWDGVLYDDGKKYSSFTSVTSNNGGYYGNWEESNK